MGEEVAKIGVYVCHCDKEIASIINPERLVEYAKGLPGVSVVRSHSLMCSDAGLKIIKDDIKNGRANRIVVAACSPRLHEETFRNACQDAGLNPCLVEMANIREQATWVCTNESEKAYELAKDLVRIAVAKAVKLKPLSTKKVPVMKNSLVIGGDVCGASAALEMADGGYKVYLVENGPEIFADLKSKIGQHSNIDVLVNTTVKEINGCVGNYRVKIESGLEQKSEREVEAGTIIIATGQKEHEPKKEDYRCRAYPKWYALAFWKDLRKQLNRETLSKLWRDFADMRTSGIYVCGIPESGNVSDAISKAKAAATKAMELMNEGEAEIRPYFSVIDEDFCGKCHACLHVCELDAIKKTEDRIEIDDIRCEGCGSCASTCPAGAITANQFTDEQMRAMIDVAVEKKNEKEFDPYILGFFCNWCSYAGADNAGISRLQRPHNLRIIRVMCTARVDPSYILDALTKGADGVLICGCRPDHCHYITGNYKTDRIVLLTKNILKQVGIEPERLRRELMSADEGQNLAGIVKDFVEELKRLGAKSFSKTVSLLTENKAD